MLSIIILVLSCMTIGFTLGMRGITYRNWEYWVVLTAFIIGLWAHAAVVFS